MFLGGLERIYGHTTHAPIHFFGWPTLEPHSKTVSKIFLDGFQRISNGDR
jgi:hypothetical protein